MRTLTVALVLIVAPLAYAQPKSMPKIDPANPLSSSMKMGYDRVKGFITAAAEEMPPAEYAFKPSRISGSSKILMYANFAPVARNTLTVFAENPHWGKSGVPFI